MMRRNAWQVVALVGVAASVGLMLSCEAPESSSIATRPQASAAAGEHTGRVLVALPSPNEAAPRDYPGIHNVVAYHDGFVSGAAPEGAAGFDTLQQMGVRTIISVDGAAPDVASASARGMRYIHLPIGYNGFDEARRLQLVRATQDAMQAGPIYIHCHHGKHRSAGAAAAIAASLGWIAPEGGIERMRVSGTAPGYKGLYACAASSSVLAANVIAAVPADFPQIATPSSFVKAMVDIDEAIEALKAIEKAGWNAPRDHPDLVPVAEAGRVADHLRFLVESARTRDEPVEFRALLLENGARAQALEDALAGGKAGSGEASRLFALVNASCKECHVKYRD